MTSHTDRGGPRGGKVQDHRDTYWFWPRYVRFFVLFILLQLLVQNLKQHTGGRSTRCRAKEFVSQTGELCMLLLRLYVLLRLYANSKCRIGTLSKKWETERWRRRSWTHKQFDTRTPGNRFHSRIPSSPFVLDRLDISHGNWVAGCLEELRVTLLVSMPTKHFGARGDSIHFNTRLFINAKNPIRPPQRYRRRFSFATLYYKGDVEVLRCADLESFLPALLPRKIWCSQAANGSAFSGFTHPESDNHRHDRPHVQ